MEGYNKFVIIIIIIIIKPLVATGIFVYLDNLYMPFIWNF